MRFRAVTSACAVALVAAGTLTAVAARSDAQEVTAVDCGSTTYRFLFWPEGHGALTSVPHPATDLPHLDVYSGKGKKFTESQNVAYADGTAAATTATCTPAELPGSGSASLRTSPQAAQLVCKFTTNPVFVAVPESTVEFPSLSVLVDGALALNAQLGDPGTGSSLDYDAKSCKVKKSPK